ncbi:MAG: sirohydrochlorin cobaltochelatase [Lachnospiraceae bacterium]|nr:sirohydrochlorin cobaltochelatase [Lachnospiraceae bacterium]
MSKSVIILASVGTNILRAKKASYDMIRKDLEQYSGLDLLHVFTDDTTAKAVSTSRHPVYTVENAVETAIKNGADRILVIPVFMTKGELYNELKSRLDFYNDTIEIKIADSVLHDDKSCVECADILIKIFEFSSYAPEKVYLLVDHGNPYYKGAAMSHLQKSLEDKSIDNVKVIQLKEKDSFGQAVAWLKQKKADETNAQVVIVPLIVAWGDYMADELYNSDDSFMWKLREAGYRSVFTGKGLGEYEEFRAVYRARLDAIKD